MKVCDLLNESSINLQSKAENKREAIKALVKLMNKNKNLKKVGEFQKVVIETEEKENADSSSGYVVLCGKTNNVTRLGISIIVTKEEIEFNENIRSVCYNSKYIGVIVENNGKFEKAYKLK